jgi:hypothetical protein
MRLAVVAVAILAASLGSCIIVADDDCDSGDSRCIDDVAEVCSGGEWEVFMDCYDCAGYCDYDEYGSAACFCP